ncbi:MAG: hypothetical protein IKA79_04395, partial [Lentisphaeria bacterium]|nr:hypothetical protein [Lentisphaeria bacterium]
MYYILRKCGSVAKLFCGEETFLKKGSLPHTPFSKTNNHIACAALSQSLVEGQASLTDGSVTFFVAGSQRREHHT